MIKVTSNGITFEVGTEPELHMVMNVIAKGVKSRTPELSKPIPSKDAFAKLFELSSDNARTVIKSLRDKLEGMTLDDFKNIGLSGSTLGGTLGGITKTAKRLGISGEDVIRCDYSVTPEKYYLGDKMREGIEGH